MEKDEQMIPVNKNKIIEKKIFFGTIFALKIKNPPANDNKMGISIPLENPAITIRYIMVIKRMNWKNTFIKLLKRFFFIIASIISCF